MKIADNTPPAYFVAKSHGIEPGQGIARDGVWMERAHRQIIEAIEAHDDPAVLRDYMDRESLLIDQLYMEFPEYAAAIDSSFEEQLSVLNHVQENLGKSPNTGSAPAIPAIAQSKPPEKRKTSMFATNKTEGSSGPWMTWSSNGSAGKGFKPKSWIRRGTHENGEKFEEMFDGFANPCVFDLESLKLGWEKDGATGQAPERVYSSHYSVAMPRPDESKKATGGYTWSNALQVRVATSPDEAYTWEQGAFGAYEGFTRLAKLIESEWEVKSQNGVLLPVVQMTEVETLNLKSGTANIPILEIIKWAERPAVLKDDAPTIATQPAAVAAATAPAPQEAATAGGF